MFKYLTNLGVTLGRIYRQKSLITFNEIIYKTILIAILESLYFFSNGQIRQWGRKDR